MAAGNTQYVLWRQDDNGNVMVMARYHSREQAQRVCKTYQSRGHKQLYWVSTLQPREIR